MLSLLAFGALGIGFVVGRLYSFVGVLLVSPLVWLLAAVAMRRTHAWSWALLEALAVLVALHGGFLLGAALRLGRQRRSDQASEAVAPDPKPERVI